MVRRSIFLNQEIKQTSFKGIKLIDLHPPNEKCFKVIIPTLLAVFYAKRKGINKKVVNRKGVEIKDGVWIVNGATLLDGVTECEK